MASVASLYSDISNSNFPSDSDSVTFTAATFFNPNTAPCVNALIAAQTMSLPSAAYPEWPDAFTLYICPDFLVTVSAYALIFTISSSVYGCL